MMIAVPLPGFFRPAPVLALALHARHGHEARHENLALPQTPRRTQSQTPVRRQGHPDQWNDARRTAFVRLVDFLQASNIPIVTPTELVASLAGSKP